MRYDKLKVLVVDDMTSMRMMIKSLLRELGVETIHEANDGETALEKIVTNHLDLIICDWDMPNGTGLEVLQQVREDNDSVSLPFIMLTAVANRDMVVSAIDAGVSDYVIKPFKPEALIKKIQQVVV